MPAPFADAATSYSRTALSVQVDGASVTATTRVKASRTTTASAYGVCVRNSAGANRDYARKGATVTRTGTSWKGTKSFSPGTYSYWSCLKVAGRWHNVGARKSFTVRATPGSASHPRFASVLREDFTAAAPPNKVLKTYARSMVAYDDTTQYRRSNLSARDGRLDISLTRNTGAAVVFGPPSSVWGRKYGKFDVRFKVEGGSGHGSAFMLWPSSNVWSEGEIDFPEGSFDEPFSAYHHPTPCDLTDRGPVPHCGSSVRHATKNSWRTWHTASTEWEPGAVRYYLDGRLLKTVTHDVPRTNHRMTIQAAPVAPKAQPGHLLIDWFAISSYTG